LALTVVLQVWSEDGKKLLGTSPSQGPGGTAPPLRRTYLTANSWDGKYFPKGSDESDSTELKQLTPGHKYKLKLLLYPVLAAADRLAERDVTSKPLVYELDTKLHLVDDSVQEWEDTNPAPESKATTKLKKAAANSDSSSGSDDSDGSSSNKGSSGSSRTNGRSGSSSRSRSGSDNGSSSGSGRNGSGSKSTGSQGGGSSSSKSGASSRNNGSSSRTKSGSSSSSRTKSGSGGSSGSSTKSSSGSNSQRSHKHAASAAAEAATAQVSRADLFLDGRTLPLAALDL
jgi:hypothetical protein